VTVRLQLRVLNRLYMAFPEFVGVSELVGDKTRFRGVVTEFLSLLVSRRIVVRRDGAKRFVYRLVSLYWTPETVVDALMECKRSSYVISL
jgi:hypothetical protein